MGNKAIVISIALPDSHRHTYFSQWQPVPFNEKKQQQQQLR